LGEVIADRDINQMTRAQVTALMAKEILAGRTTRWGGLKLDLSGNLDIPEMIHYKEVMDKRKRFEKVRKAYGEEAFNWKKPWDISPSAHYMMGGIKVRSNGCSTLRGLYAVGEVAGGAMGANRLGSTSITDVFVVGMEAGRETAESSIGYKKKQIRKSLIAREVKKVEQLFEKKGTKRPVTIKRELQQLMRGSVGIARDEARLSYALSEIQRMEHELENDLSITFIRQYNTDFLDAVELKNMLTCAKMMAFCALMRRESRGSHLRLDYPKKDDANWLKNIIVWKEDDHLQASTSDVTNIKIYGRESREQ
jgi:succinate dehydrogenase/fumarate reductase flavoprotein subunit